MYAHLTQHALKNVWCNPRQDNQIILQASRISRYGGEKVSMPIMKRRVTLPTSDHRYHVYWIGQVNPMILGLLPKDPVWEIGTWKAFSEAVTKTTLFADLYTDIGIHIPLHKTYYMYTSDRALVFAVNMGNKSQVDYEVEKIYLRLYTNAYYESDRANALEIQTRCEGRTILNTQDILAYQSLVATYRNKTGYTFCFINGHLVNDINLLTTKIGDVVEVYYDASVKKVVDFEVNSLDTFTSLLDQEYKYFLHYEKEEGEEQVIDYVDDIDVYVIKKSNKGFVGRYLHKNREQNLRMVTHRDYSLSVGSYVHIADHFKEMFNDPNLGTKDFTVRLFIRHGGMIRPLIYDHHRLFELYKLPDEEVRAAFLGIGATVEEWYAPVLENGAYTKLMRIPYKDVNIEVIEDAYGYNGITKVIGETPTRTRDISGRQAATLSIGHYTNSTVYEYSAEGRLLGYHHHLIGTTYHPRNNECRLVEAIVGTGSNAPSVRTGTNFIPLPLDYSYRVYMCYLVNGVPDRNWVDITGTAHYSVRDGVLHWNNLETEQWLMVRTDESFLTQDLSIVPVAGTVYFDLAETIDGQLQVMQVPMGDLDIWLNGKSLIYGLDYHVRFPRVYIVNKEHLIQPAGSTPQKVTVRFTGFCDKDLQLRVPGDYGFVEHGVLSNNSRFDIRDDKVLRITLRGDLKTRKDLVFSELHQGVSTTNALNGSPYQVKEVIIPLRGFTDEETYSLREKSLAVDKAVSDYLTLKLPQPERPALTAIPNRYKLYSPFISHIVNDLNSGQFNKENILKPLSDGEVVELCRPYEHLLGFDPISPDIEVDHRYIVIHPHQLGSTIGLDLDSYRFVQRVVELYGNGRIQLSPHLNVSLGG